MIFDWRTGWTTRAPTTGSGLEDTLEMLRTPSPFTMDTSSQQLTGNKTVRTLALTGILIQLRL
jgi:hypothetical protein